MLKTDGIIVGCFGTKNKQEFENTYQRIFLRISEKAKAVTALALTNDLLAKQLGKHDLTSCQQVVKDCQQVRCISLFMSDGSQYRLFRQFAKQNHYTIDEPILQKYGHQVAELINQSFPKQKDCRIICLAHGSLDYDNQPYKQLQKRLRDDFTICLSEANQSIESCVINAQEKKLILFPLMFCQGHHFKHQAAKFVESCQQQKKEYAIYPTSLASSEAFINILLESINE